MKIKIGVAGAGSFSLFSVDAFLQNTNITVSGVFDIDPERSLVFASKYNARIYNTLDELIKSDDINLIYISTPPGLHYEQSKSALEISEGIFIEHVVHFFDMFEGWLGQGTLISSQKIKRSEIRLLFERGDVTLHEWIPVQLEIHGLGVGTKSSNNRISD